MDKQIEKVIKHIKDLESRLGYVDNNLRYIKVIQALNIGWKSLQTCLVTTKHYKESTKQPI